MARIQNNAFEEPSSNVDDSTMTADTQREPEEPRSVIKWNSFGKRP